MGEQYVDIISELYVRNMINIIGSILDHLSAACLENFQATCKLYREIVEDDRTSWQRLSRHRGWRTGFKTVQSVYSARQKMVTSLVTAGDAIIFSTLGQNVTVEVFSKNTLTRGAQLTQSSAFPAAITALDYNDLVVVTCAIVKNQAGEGPSHEVYVWWRNGDPASELQPHCDIIRAVKLTSKYLLTGGNDRSIVVTDLSRPDQPRQLHRLTHHQAYVSSMDSDLCHFVSVSVDNVLKVWSLQNFSVKFSIDTDLPTLKVSMRWPLAATGGGADVALWNIEKGSLIRKLLMNTGGCLNVLTLTPRPDLRRRPVSDNTDLIDAFGHAHMKRKTSRRSKSENKLDDTIHLASGDNQGKICLWDVSKIIAGHPGKTPDRYIGIGSEGSRMVSGLALDGNSLISSHWSACGCQVLLFDFNKK